MAKKVKVICDTCGKEIEKYESRVSTHNFCNRECYLKFHAAIKQKYICEICGKEFIGSNGNANRFCSRECYNIFHNIKNKERECPKCHKKFFAKTSEDKYCSWECYNADRHPPKGENHWNWQGGISLEHDNRDSAQYKEWRKAVYKRDNYKCQICGSKEKLNAHHIKSWKNFPELRYDVDNGITYCEACHIKWHQEHDLDEEL